MSSSVAASPTVAVGNISGVASSIHVPRVNGQNGRKPDKGIRWGLPLARFRENGENGAKMVKIVKMMKMVKMMKW